MARIRTVEYVCDVCGTEVTVSGDMENVSPIYCCGIVVSEETFEVPAKRVAGAKTGVKRAARKTTAAKKTATATANTAKKPAAKKTAAAKPATPVKTRRKAAAKTAGKTVGARVKKAASSRSVRSSRKK